MENAAFCRFHVSTDLSPDLEHGRHWLSCIFVVVDVVSKQVLKDKLVLSVSNHSTELDLQQAFRRF